MKTICSLILLAAIVLLSNACVSREVSASSPLNKGEEKVIEKKLIWIWQDEYRNP